MAFALHLQLAAQPKLEVSKGQSVLAAALKGPLAGNFCPGGSSAPFTGCPPGTYCPTPAQHFQCPAVSLRYPVLHDPSRRVEQQ